MSKDDVVGLINVPAKVLKPKPTFVSVRVKYDDGSEGQWWIPCPTQDLATRIANYINTEYLDYWSMDNHES